MSIGYGYGIPLLRLQWQPIGGPPGGAPSGDGLLLEDGAGYVAMETGVDLILLG